MLRIYIAGTNLDDVNFFVNQILTLVQQAGIEKRGPISLPRKVLRVPTMITLGKRGKKVYETYQMRVYRKVVDVAYDENFVKNFLKLQIPPNIQLKLKLINK